MDKIIDIVIVNWNAGPQLHDCITSIQKFGYPYVMQTIVVDNGSTDGSEKSIRDIPSVRVISAGDNLGFAKACNLGAQYAQSDFLLFLNPDAALHNETLPLVIAFMEQPENAMVGICGVQLINEEGHINRCCSNLPSIFTLIGHAIGIDRILPSFGPAMSDWDHKTTRQVGQVMGAFFLVRRCLFDELQGFDERFFVYFEEVDFSCRAKQLGWSSVYFADAQAFHAGCGTSNQVKANRLFYLQRSRILYAFKHLSLFGASLVFLATLLVEPLSRSVFAIVRTSLTSLKETWSAYGMLIHWFPNLILKGKTR